MIKWDLSQGGKDFLVTTNQSVWYNTLKIWRIEIKRSSQYIQKKKKKDFDKIQHLLMIKSPQKMGTKGCYLNIIKVQEGGYIPRDWTQFLCIAGNQTSKVSVVVVVQSQSCVWLFATPCTAARQAPLSLSISWCLPKFIKSI